MSDRPVIHVVAGAVMDAGGRVLIAQRPDAKHLAGGWEFPGGKLEPGEERACGLARELHEELGITIAIPRPLIRVRHAYPSRDILLDVWVVRTYSGTPRGLDGQALRWCTRDELTEVQLLPADGPIVRVLWLPERLTQVATSEYEISDMVSAETSDCGGERGDAARLRGAFCASVDEARAAVARGAEFLALREPLADAELAALCSSVPVPVYAQGISLSDAWVLGASGVNAIRG